MGPVEGVFIYLLWWWVLLFTVLPWRIGPRAERQPGHDAGAPANPYLRQKFLITSLLAGVGTFTVWLFIPADAEDRGGALATLLGFG